MRIISLGMGSYVDADEIVAISEASATLHRQECTILPWNGINSLVDGDALRSVVLLRNGDIWPAYVCVETVLKRWRGEQG
jgi:regulator of extracellular matrix RemA (YlzA/DUF370 family)